ncbi:MAG: hypothetical protein FWC58_00405 [Desulfobulbus sp.]|nr:hypothetical protein [Desulfobulbus sp.]
MTWLSNPDGILANGWLSSAFPGHGILGSEIPTGGDNPGPALNDGIDPDAEYRWRVATWPSAGSLRIWEDLSFVFDADGLPAGIYSWVYELFEDGQSVGTATIAITVGNPVAELDAMAVGGAAATGMAGGAVIVSISASGGAAASGAPTGSASVTLGATGAASASGTAQATASENTGPSAFGKATASGSAQPAVAAPLAASGAVSASGQAHATLTSPGGQAAMTPNIRFMIVAPRRSYVIGRKGIHMISAKDPAEIITVTFDFSRIATAVISPIVSCELARGQPHDDIEAMLDGPLQIHGLRVLQRVIGGLAGNLYRLRCQIDDADGERWAVADVMPVRRA